MILTLEVTGSQASKLGSASRHEFGSEGGSIGRDTGSTWVLPHTKISSLHALISHRNSVFYIEDRSRNGVCLNASANRLLRGQQYPLKSGDSILIDPYEIRVSVESGRRDAPHRPAAAERDRYSLQESDPFDGDPFAPLQSPPLSVADPDSPFDPASGGELDPLKLLDPIPKPLSAHKAPNARDLARGSPMDGHYRPPPPIPVAPSPPWDPHAIPQDYNPLAPDDLTFKSDDVVAEPENAPAIAAPLPPPLPRSPAPPPPPPWEPPPPPTPPLERRPLREQPAAETPPRDSTPTPASEPAADGSHLLAMLAGAGLDGVAVTPELAKSFGEILRVVVSGVMDVLRARQQIKDEFRMRMTQFRPVDNNPLKFSANVDDALHNLLVKRNAAYLGPVEAFEDAFDDLRNHQIAMLAGMRVAFESMLAQFDPDKLQEQFDRQLKKGSLLGVPSRLRYWDSYRDVCTAMARDPEASFRKLFGEEFAKAYEEQLKRLKTEGTPARAPGKKPE